MARTVGEIDTFTTFEREKSLEAIEALAVEALKSLQDTQPLQLVLAERALTPAGAVRLYGLEKAMEIAESARSARAARFTRLWKLWMATSSAQPITPEKSARYEKGAKLWSLWQADEIARAKEYDSIWQTAEAKKVSVLFNTWKRLQNVEAARSMQAEKSSRLWKLWQNTCVAKSTSIHHSAKDLQNFRLQRLQKTSRVAKAVKAVELISLWKTTRTAEHVRLWELWQIEHGARAAPVEHHVQAALIHEQIKAEMAAVSQYHRLVEVANHQILELSKLQRT